MTPVIRYTPIQSVVPEQRKINKILASNESTSVSGGDGRSAVLPDPRNHQSVC